MSDLLLNLLTTHTVIGLAVGAAVAALVAFLASAKGARFKAYEGYAVTAVRIAEKAIPDTTPNKSLAKLDYALRIFLGKYEKATGVKADASTTAKIENWIATIHQGLDEAGLL